MPWRCFYPEALLARYILDASVNFHFEDVSILRRFWLDFIVMLLSWRCSYLETLPTRFSFEDASILRLFWLDFHLKTLLSWDTSGSIFIWRCFHPETLLPWRYFYPETLLARYISDASVNFHFKDASILRRFRRFSFWRCFWLDFHLKMLLSWDASSSIFIWRCFHPEMLLPWKCFYLDLIETLVSWRCFYLDFLETLLPWRCFYFDFIWDDSVEVHLKMLLSWDASI